MAVVPLARDMTTLEDPPTQLTAPEPTGTPPRLRWWTLLLRRPGAVPAEQAMAAAWWKGGFAYLVSRAFVVGGAAVAAASRVPRPSSAGGPVVDVLTSWDGLWYLDLARHGYPSSVIPQVTFFDADARTAFFPLYPGLVRLVDRVLPFGDVFAALLANFVLGALLVVLVGLLTKRLAGPAAAGRAMVLTALFPGSFVLSFAYAEALMLVLVAACFLLVLQRRWITAGLVAAVATASRPNATALVAALAVAAVLAVWREREWRALAAPVLAPIGFVAFHLYLWQHTGEATVWFRVQHEAWNEGTSYGVTAITRAGSFLLSPFDSASNALTALCLVAVVVGLVFLWKAKLPAVMNVYALGVLFLMLLPATVTARPRFLFTAFPLLIAVAVTWPDDHDDGWAYLLSLCAAGLLATTALYGVLAAIP